MKTLLPILMLTLAYAQNSDCTIGEDPCYVPVATETIHPIAQAHFTATAILTDSCTVCGKDPVQFPTSRNTFDRANG